MEFTLTGEVVSRSVEFPQMLLFQFGPVFVFHVLAGLSGHGDDKETGGSQYEGLDQD